ncbi:MAG: peptidyl-prolyl cis-trans isomerase [Chthoniobacterales bacterium]
MKSANVKSANAKSANAKSANVKSAKVKTAEVESGKMSHDKLPPQAVILTAFKLGKVGEVSDIVQIGQAFYITSLVHLTPSRPLTFEEAQLRIETLLRTEKADKVMNAAATKTYQAIHQAMAAGKTFEDALKASGATAELLANVIPADNSKGKISPQQQEAINTTLSLKEGELSELKRDRGGEFIVYLQHRAPLSDADWKAHQPEIQEAFLGQQRDLLFFDWLRQSRADAHVEMLNRSKTRRRR